MPVKKRDEVVLEEVPGGVKTFRQVLIGADEGPNFAMRRFVLEPGDSMPNHTNTVEHEQYVLGGKATVCIGEDIFQVEASDVVYIPAGVPHWYRTEGDESFEFLCMVPNLPDEIKLVE